MANEQNLTHVLTVCEQRKGGQISGKVRKEKRLIKEILGDLLNCPVKDSPQLIKLADKLGVSTDKSVKDVFTMVCLYNSMKSGDLSELERLRKLLDEENGAPEDGEIEDDAITKALKEEAERLNNAH